MKVEDCLNHPTCPGHSWEKRAQHGLIKNHVVTQPPWNTAVCGWCGTWNPDVPLEEQAEWELREE